MRTFLIKWPDCTVSILTARSEMDLYSTLDEVADPEDCDIYLLPLEFAIDLVFQKDGKERILKDGEELYFSFGCFEGFVPAQRWEFGDNAFESYFLKKDLNQTGKFSDGVDRFQNRRNAKLKEARTKKIKINPLQIIGAMNGIKHVTNKN